MKVDKTYAECCDDFFVAWCKFADKLYELIEVIWERLKGEGR